MNRALFQKLPVQVTARAKKAINAGNATVVVTVYSNRITVEIEGE